MKKILFGLIILFVTTLLFKPMFLMAEEEQMTEELYFDEIPIVTIASRTEQKLTEAPAAITVITAEDIAHSGYNNIWDLLRNQPGMDVLQASGNYPGVSARGFTGLISGNMQVLLDGRSIFDASSAGTYWRNHPIILEDIKQIEIMRGPNSVLYGVNAVNGVINIKTKDAKETKGVASKVTIGNLSTQEYYGRIADTIGNFDYRVSYERANSQGQGNNDGKEVVDGMRQNRINSRSRYTISDDKNIEFFAGGTIGILGGTPLGVDYTIREVDDYQQLKYNQEFSKDSSLYLQFFRYALNDPLKDRDGTMEDARQYDWEFQHNFKAFTKHTFVWGANWRKDMGRTLTCLDPATWRRNITSRIFGQDTYTLTDKLTLYGGLEYSHDKYVGTNLSTRETLMYNLFGDNFIRATYGRAYHAFGLGGQYYMNYGGVMVGRTDLERTSVDTFEIGYRGNALEKKLSYDFEWFYNKYNKVLHYEGFPVTMSNGDRAKSFGFETSFDYKPFKWLKTYLNHTYLMIDDKTEDWRFQSPKNRVNWGALITMNKKYLPDFLDVKLSYVGKSYPGDQLLVAYYKVVAPTVNQKPKVGQYYKLDITLGKKFFKDRVEFKVAGLNLLEPHHYEYGDTIVIDRQVLGSVKVEF